MSLSNQEVRRAFLEWLAPYLKPEEREALLSAYEIMADMRTDDPPKRRPGRPPKQVTV